MAVGGEPRPGHVDEYYTGVKDQSCINKVKLTLLTLAPDNNNFSVILYKKPLVAAPCKGTLYFRNSIVTFYCIVVLSIIINIY